MRHVLNRRSCLGIVGALAASAALAPAASAAPSFSAPAHVAVLPGAIAVATGDFNGDGHQDLAAAVGGANVSVRLGTGSGSFTGSDVSTTNYATHGSPIAIVAADFNRDGKLDLATANGSTGDVSVLLGNGDGTFGTHTDFSAVSNPRTIAVGDFNEDNRLDLAVGASDATPGHVAVLLGSTTPGSFSAPTLFAAGASPASVVVADFDNDGHQDLAVANAATIGNPTGDISVLLGTGSGSFSPPTSHSAGANANLRGLAVGDFNADGNEDLAVANADPAANDVVVVLGNGTGSFSAPSPFSVDNNPAGVTVADFDRDGHLDLAVANQGGDDASVLLGSGTGSFGAATNFSAHNGPRAITTADFNGDGKQDLAVLNSSSADISVLLNTTTVPVLAQLGSPNGCLTFTTTSGCGSLNGSGFQPTDVAVGPDGSGPSNVYLASPQGIVVLNRDRSTGVLTQAGCLNAAGSGGCTQLHGLTGAVDGQLGISPDGGSVYMATGVALLTLTRSTTTGALTPLSCINQDASDTCTQDRQGTSFVPDWVRVGPESTSAYAGPGPNQAAGVMSEFTRNTTTGALTQPGGATGCVSATGLDGNGGTCTQVDELGNETDIAFSPSAKLAWVSSHSSATIVGFSRNSTTGVLTPLTGANRCVVDVDSASGTPTCSSARALQGAGRLVRAGKNLYVTTSNGTDEGVAEFETRAGGALAQLPGASGCLTTSGHDGETLQGNCTRSRVTAGGGDMAGPREFVATPDGVDLFVEGETNATVTTLGRDVETGALSDVACIGDNTGGSTCSQGTGMPDLSGIAMAPDGRNVYGSTANGVVALNRHLRRSVSGSASPSAGGSVAASSSSANAQCSGSACTVEDGGTVTLTATAASGYRFTGWSGACAGQSSPCTVQNVTGDQSAVANFARRVTVSGTASPATGGSVAASSPSGGAACAGASCTVDAGSSVTLTETPAAGYRFGGWSGACSGSAPICTASNVTADQTATATFVRRYTVSGAANPAAGGSVSATSGAPGSVCNANTCAVDAGDTVTLRANPASGYKFTGWSGACTGTADSCTLSNVNSDLSAVAAFEPLAGSTSTSGSSTVTASKDGKVPTGITVHCPRPCTFIGIGKVTLPKSLAGKRAVAARNVTLTLAKTKKSLKAGASAKVVLKLTRKGMKILKRLHKLRMKVTVNLTAAGAAPVIAKRTLTVKAPKKKGH